MSKTWLLRGGENHKNNGFRRAAKTTIYYIYIFRKGAMRLPLSPKYKIIIFARKAKFSKKLGISEMYNLQFFMPMDPPRTTFQAKDLAVIKGRPVIFDSAELIAVKAKLRGHLAKYIPEEPIGGPLRVMVKWCYPATAPPFLPMVAVDLPGSGKPPQSFFTKSA